MPKEVLAVKAETKQIETAWIYFSEPSPHRPPEKKQKIQKQRNTKEQQQQQ